MIKIFGGRGTGKTTKLIEISAEKQIPILCCNDFQRIELMRKATSMGYKIPIPVLLTSELKIEDLENGESVLVDDAEVILKRLLKDLKFNLEGFVISKNDLGEELYEL